MIKIIIIIITAIISGFLSAMAGSDKFPKYLRRYVMPGLIFLSCFINTFNFWCICLIFMAVSLSMGHGIPSSTDKGSTIGRFWAKIINNSNYQDILTRITLSLVLSLSLIFVPIITNNWVLFFISSFLISLNMVVFGGDAIINKEGTTFIFGDDLLNEEIIIAFINSLIICSYVSFSL